MLLALVSGTVIADESEIWVQRWGILDGKSLCDYDTQSGQLLTSHRDCAVLWNVKSGLALRRYLPLAESSFVTHDGCILAEHILLGGTHFVSLLNKQNGQLIRSFDLEGGRLNSFAINKKSTLLATSTGEGKLYIWEMETGRPLHVIDAQRSLQEMEFSPDSRLLLCGSDENVATLWNVETGQLHDRLNSPTDVRQVAFSDDGCRMLTAGFGTYVHTPRVVVWDVASLVPQQIIPRTAMDASFVGENVRIVLPGGEVELWGHDRHEDPPPPSEPSKKHEGDFRLAGITRNHWVLRSPRDASQLSLRDASQRSFRDASQWSLSNASQLSLMGPDSNETIVDVHPETPQWTSDDHFPLAISGDGGLLLTGGSSHGSRPNRSALWNLNEGKIQFELVEFENEFLGAFHPDGKRVVLSRERKLTVLDAETGETLKTMEVNDKEYWGGTFTSLRFTHDGKRLLTAHGDWYDGDAGAIFLWDFESGDLLRNYAKDTKAVMFAEMTRDEKWILAALTPGNDGSAGIDQLSVIDAETGEFKTTRMFNDHGFNADTGSPLHTYKTQLHFMRPLAIRHAHNEWSIRNESPLRFRNRGQQANPFLIVSSGCQSRSFPNHTCRSPLVMRGSRITRNLNGRPLRRFVRLGQMCNSISTTG